MRVFREYDFVTFDNIGGNATITVIMAASLNANTDENPLQYSLQIDSQAVQTVTPIGPEVPGGVPTGWETNDGWVANSDNPQTFNVSLNPGTHTLKVRDFRCYFRWRFT